MSSAYTALEEKSRIESDRLRKEHDLAMSQARSESDKQYSELKALQLSLREASDNGQKELQKRDRKIQKLGNKVRGWSLVYARSIAKRVPMLGPIASE